MSKPAKILEIKTEADLEGIAKQSEIHKFEILDDDHYRLTVPAAGFVLEVDRLRRERHELAGELAVFPLGIRTIGSALSIADFNLSSARARQERANILEKRSKAVGPSWSTLIEELCQLILEADRNGRPAVDLRSIALPEVDDGIEIEKLWLARRLPSILFGDGGAAKSYLALYIGGLLAGRGMRVGLFDWELTGEDHRARLQRLFGLDMPLIHYAACTRPLVHEVDRLRRIVRDNQIDYAIFDSVAFACDGPPEAAEVAGRYFRCARQIGIGSLHIAHVNRSQGGEDKPFGSVFWYNSARSIWLVKATEQKNETGPLTIGAFHKKCNLGAKRRPVGFQIEFGDMTIFTRTDLRDEPELSDALSVRERMVAALRQGALDVEILTEDLRAKKDTVTRTARRYPNQFVLIDGGRKVGLKTPRNDAGFYDRGQNED